MECKRRIFKDMTGGVCIGAYLIILTRPLTHCKRQRLHWRVFNHNNEVDNRILSTSVVKWCAINQS